jgi:hypothetical protein
MVGPVRARSSRWPAVSAAYAKESVMWFWIALMAFFLIVFLVTKVVVHSQGGIHHVGLQQGCDVSLSGGWSGTGDGLDGLGESGAGGSAGGAAGDAGWGAGDGGGW